MSQRFGFPPAAGILWTHPTLCDGLFHERRDAKSNFNVYRCGLGSWCGRVATALAERAAIRHTHSNTPTRAAGEWEGWPTPLVQTESSQTGSSQRYSFRPSPSCICARASRDFCRRYDLPSITIMIGDPAQIFR